MNPDFPNYLTETLRWAETEYRDDRTYYVGALREAADDLIRLAASMERDETGDVVGAADGVILPSRHGPLQHTAVDLDRRAGDLHWKARRIAELTRFVRTACDHDWAPDEGTDGDVENGPRAPDLTCTRCGTEQKGGYR